LPSIFQIGGYKIFFWSLENIEPIHVHVGKGKPSSNSTKIWITSSGGCIVANNRSKIPQKELSDLLKVISAQFFVICDAWKNHFETEKLNFFC
jgi:hypothetical protein